jgi:ABC-type transport system involved in multi-copper enzyme maturation permease subunit
MGRAYAIALNAFREAVRDRVLFGVLGLALASLLFGTSLAWLSISEQVRVLVDHGLVTISWLANLVAIFLGASFLYKEIELRTLYVILAKPVARWQFVLGRYLGILSTAVVFVALTATALLVLLDFVAAESQGASGVGVSALAQQLRSSRALRAAFLLTVSLVFLLGTRVAARVTALARVRSALSGAGAMLWSLALLALTASVTRSVVPDETVYVLAGALMVVLEVSITAALATLVSSFSTPFVTGALSLGLFLIGRSTGAMLELKGRQLPSEIMTLIKGVPEVFPNLYLYVPSRQSLSLEHGAAPVLSFISQLALYGAVYAAIFVGVASWLFRRRDLT